MTATEALNYFEAQVKRLIQSNELKIKVVRAPLAIREPGLVIRVLPRKVFLTGHTQAERNNGNSALTIALLLSGRIDSDTAMERLLSSSEFLMQCSLQVHRLENTDGETILNSRISWSTSSEDAVFEDPADDTVVWAREEWRVVIYLP